jgi:hypothetical protein
LTVKIGLKFEGAIFGKFSLVHPREGITDKLHSRDNITWLKWPQNIHKKHTYLMIFEELWWDYTGTIHTVLVLKDYFLYTASS